MAECEGVFADFKRKCKQEGIREGMRKGKQDGEKAIISRLLSEKSISSVAILLKMSESDIMEILRD